MEILGIEFDEKTPLKDVLTDFKRRHISLDSIPYHYWKEKEKIRINNENNQTAQELIDETGYIDLTIGIKDDN